MIGNRRGTGSGTWCRIDAKQTTDQFLELDVNLLARDDLLRPGIRSQLDWKQPGKNKTIASVGFSVFYAAGKQLVFHVSYQWNDIQNIETRIPLLTSMPNFGGRRRWFSCPGKGRGPTCAKRVAKLFLVNGQFACRECHNLTYRSCQEAHAAQRFEDRILKRCFGDSWKLAFFRGAS